MSARPLTRCPDHVDSRLRPYLLAVMAVLPIPLTMIQAGGARAQPIIPVLWAVLAVVIVLTARRKTMALPIGDHSLRVIAAVRQLDYEVPEVRLNALRELAAIADEWPAGRQACVDAICTYLRRPVAAGCHERGVRRAAIALICSHLQPDAGQSWRGLNLNLAGAMIDGGSFAGAHFDNCVIDFTGAHFAGDAVLFSLASFDGATVHFTGASFSASVVDFAGAQFHSGTVDFSNARQTAGTLDFSYVVVDRSRLSFRAMHVGGRLLDFHAARIEDSSVSFAEDHLRRGLVRLDHMSLNRAEVTFGPDRPMLKHSALTS